MLVFPGCKINIGLEVVERLPNGYHRLQSIFWPSQFTDVLEIHQVEHQHEAKFWQTGLQLDTSTGTNLVEKARDAFNQVFGEKHYYIHLHKTVPFGAGLGGGSADAAATLKAMAAMHSSQIPESLLLPLAKKLGADCSFFLHAKPAYLNGIGHELKEISISLSGWHLVIVHPRILVPTPWAFSQIKPQKSQIDLLEKINEPVTNWVNYIKNDFESIVFEAFPAIKSLKEQLYKMGACFALMSGSGSAVFALFEKEIAHLQDYFPAYVTWQEKIK